MRSRCSRRALSTGCRRRWSGAAPATGGHVWVFFAAAGRGRGRRAGSARCCCATAMTRRGELDLASYDRLFPNQDFLPAEGVRQPDRAAAAGPLPRRRHERLPRSGDVRAVARPVGVPRARSNGSRPSSSSVCSPSTRRSRSARQRSRTQRALRAGRASAGGDPVHDRRRPRDRQSRACRRRCSPSSSTSPRCTTRSSTSGSGCGSPPTRRRG